MTRKTRIRLGIFFIILGFVTPFFILFMDYLALQFGEVMDCTDYTVSVRGGEYSLPTIFFLSGLLMLLPIAEWITAWRGTTSGNTGK